MLSVCPAFAQWLSDGAPVCAWTSYQQNPRLVSDGKQGAIAVWEDWRFGTLDIFCQRIDGGGVLRWAAGGAALCTADGYQDLPEIASDGASGAIVVWRDYRSLADFDIYAQRIDANGAVRWTTNGAAVCTATAGQESPQIIADGQGGAIIVWFDGRNGYRDIYAQRLDQNGNALWSTDGVPICGASNHQTNPVLCPDGMGGAIIAWKDSRTTNHHIYAQRVNANGSARWTTDGVPVSAYPSEKQSLQIISDGVMGCIVSWADSRGSMLDIYAQRIDSDGSAVWTTDGVAICSAAYIQQNARLCTDGAGGAIITWEDDRVLEQRSDVYAQRVAWDGAVLWTADGVALCAVNDLDQLRPRPIADGSGGAIIAWDDYRSNADHDVYAQRLDAGGNLLWASAGALLCDSPAAQYSPAIAADLVGGAIVAWIDLRNGADDIYAQRIKENGNLPVPSFAIESIGDVPNDQGGVVEIVWSAHELDVSPLDTITHYSVWRSISGPALAALREAGAPEIDPAGLSIDYRGAAIRTAPLAGTLYAWEWLGNIEAHRLALYSYAAATLYDSTGSDPAWHYFFVSAHASGIGVYFDSYPDSGYSVDNLSPAEPQGVAGERSYEPVGLRITWTGGSETDLGRYRVYRGLDESFVPAPENLVGSPVSAAYLDEAWTWASGYYYKISAVDVHGNESSHALLRPDDVTSAGALTPPAAAYLEQNCPNPFNPQTSISFGLKAMGAVSLRIYDATGRLVRVLVDEARPAGNYTELWDGRDSRGAAVASGLYFYRFDAGTFTRTRKMVLLK